MKARQTKRTNRVTVSEAVEAGKADNIRNLHEFTFTSLHLLVGVFVRVIDNT
jgi:hypothetical protein